MWVSNLSPGSVEPLLSGRLGRPYRFVEKCESTQRLVDAGEAEGATVAADLQTHRRGRRRRAGGGPARPDVGGPDGASAALLRPAPADAADGAVAGAVPRRGGRRCGGDTRRDRRRGRAEPSEPRSRRGAPGRREPAPG